MARGSKTGGAKISAQQDKNELAASGGEITPPDFGVSAPERRRTGASVLRVLVHLSRFGLAAMFLLAAGAKLFTVREFVENLTNLVEKRWTWPVTIVVIAAELLAAILLVVPRTVRAGALLSAVLLVGFAGYALYYVYVLGGEPLECGCFGGLIASQLGVKTALRNLLLLIPALVVIFGYPRLRRARESA